MLLPALPIAFGLVAVTAASALAARRLAIPQSIVLVLVGLALSFMPFMPFLFKAVEASGSREPGWACRVYVN